MTVWVVFFYDVGPIVIGLFETELEALRLANEMHGHTVPVVLPCPDVLGLIREREK